MLTALVAVTADLVVVALLLTPAPARATEATVALGAAASYPVLGGRTITNAGPTSLDGNLGVSPGAVITGFPPGAAAGTAHGGDARAAQAQTDLATAFDDAASRTATENVAGDLAGRTLTAGVYRSTSSLALSGTLTLDGQGDPNSVFVFQVGSALTTASASAVKVVNGARACRVFWQVGSSATLGAMSFFNGTIMAMDSITVTTGAVVRGRALARGGAITLDSNTFVEPDCGAVRWSAP